MDLTDAIAQQAVAGGYNLVWMGGVTQTARAQQYGLRGQMVLSLDSLPAVGTPARTTLDAVIDWCSGAPAAYSYWLYDEPSVSQFSGLHDLVQYIHGRDPNHLAYINLFPNYTANSTLGTSKGYSDYLSQYISTVQPSMLSYDNYPFLKTSDRPEYLQNLGLISTAAKQDGIPFINIVQADGNSSPIGTDYRVPVANELRFQVYTTLAYGAQGISYFNYYNTSSTPTGGGIQPNPDGTPTTVYTALDSIEPRVQEHRHPISVAKADRRLPQRLQSQFHAAGDDATAEQFSLRYQQRFQHHAYSNGAALKGVLFGFFDKDGTTLADATILALVENLDYTASKTYTVTGPGNLSVFNATTGVWTPTGHNYATLNLAPGGGVLVGLTSTVPEPSAIVLLGTGLVILLWVSGWRKRG